MKRWPRANLITTLDIFESFTRSRVQHDNLARKVKNVLLRKGRLLTYTEVARYMGLMHRGVGGEEMLVGHLTGKYPSSWSDIASIARGLAKVPLVNREAALRILTGALAAEPFLVEQMPSDGFVTVLGLLAHSHVLTPPIARLFTAEAIRRTTTYTHPDCSLLGSTLGFTSSLEIMAYLEEHPQHVLLDPDAALVVARTPLSKFPRLTRTCREYLDAADTARLTLHDASKCLLAAGLLPNKSYDTCIRYLERIEHLAGVRAVGPTTVTRRVLPSRKRKVKIWGGPVAADGKQVAEVARPMSVSEALLRRCVLRVRTVNWVTTFLKGLLRWKVLLETERMQIMVDWCVLKVMDVRIELLRLGTLLGIARLGYHYEPLLKQQVTQGTSNTLIETLYLVAQSPTRDKEAYYDTLLRDVALGTVRFNGHTSLVYLMAVHRDCLPYLSHEAVANLADLVKAASNFDQNPKSDRAFLRLFLAAAYGQQYYPSLQKMALRTGKVVQGVKFRRGCRRQPKVGPVVLALKQLGLVVRHWKGLGVSDKKKPWKV